MIKFNAPLSWVNSGGDKLAGPCLTVLSNNDRRLSSGLNDALSSVEEVVIAGGVVVVLKLVVVGAKACTTVFDARVASRRESWNLMVMIASY
jgi:hypothetical protein